MFTKCFDIINKLFIYFYFISLINNFDTECATYLGCFKEISVNDRLFKGDRANFPKKNTPNKCVSFCEEKRFAYAGLQYSVECFCSHKKPPKAYVADEKDCNMKCDGDENLFCGGGYRMSVYLTGIEPDFEGNYVGCYKERSIQARLMSDHHTNFENTLTPSLCVKHCKDRGYEYAGLQYSYECFCSKFRPSYRDSANENDCSTKCAGDDNEICGGNYRLSVYETAEIKNNFVSTNYLNCYVDSEEKRLLFGKYDVFSNKNTPELCIGFCYRNGFRYSALQNKYCFCGNYLREESLAEESECNRKCGNNDFICGGPSRSSVYKTGITGFSEDGNLLGCFIDKEKLRVLSSLQINFEENNSPKLCLNVCYERGYKYAGVEYGIECHCGNKKPDPSLEANENQCAATCPNNPDKMCGGNWRVLVYETHYGEINPPDDKIRIKPTPTVTVPKPTPSTRPKPTESCVKSKTEVANRRNICKGEVLFRENFLDPISTNKWSYEVKMPYIPDYEFVVFKNKPQNIFVKNGKLNIKPTVMEDSIVTGGRIELQQCTGTPHSEECVRQAATYNILPPIESARITTKNSLVFKYGTVQIRAKLPRGDWIIPEMWLEPKKQVYGPTYASGRIRIAMARGNKVLTNNDEDIGNRQLESGILMGVGDNIRGRTVIRDKVDGWYKHFHNYTLIWTPDDLKFLVDGELEESIVTPGRALADLVDFDDNAAFTWRGGSNIAPFDQEFFISLGLSVGGMRDFPNDCVSGLHPKPWTNKALKGMLNFWQDRENWKSTWEDDKVALQVEHVIVTAL